MKGIKESIKYFTGGLFLILGAFTLTFAQGMGNGRRNLQRGIYGIDYVKNLPKEELSSEEITSIKYMREEEKLARDVYLKLYDYWKLPVFSNIAKSEQRHMDMIKALIEKYELQDPVKDDVKGKFSDPKMQKLYDKLIKDGKKSLNDALKVGCLIEDLDIYDLNESLRKVDNQDIKFVYNNLKRGSYNHLRSFYRVLRRYGGTYAPQYISQSEFDSIISASSTRGYGRGRRRGF